MYELKEIDENLHRIIKDNEVVGWVSKGTDSLWYVKIVGTAETIVANRRLVEDYLQGIF